MDEVSQLIIDAVSEQDIFRKAELFYNLKTAHRVRVKDLAKSAGMKASYLCHILRLIKLPEIVRDGYYNKTVSLSHLFIIARLHKTEDMIEVYEQVLAESLTATQTEELIRAKLYKVSSGGEYLEHEYESALQQSLRTVSDSVSVKIVQTRVRGKLLIELKGGLSETTPGLKTLVQKLLET